MTYTEPLILLVCCLAMGGVLLTRGRGRRIALAGPVAMLLLSWPPVDWLLSRPLEARYPVLPMPSETTAETIVVLASSVNPPTFEHPYFVLGPDTYERVEHAAWLHKNWRFLPILACGGPMDSNSTPFSVVMRQHLIRAGVAGEVIWTEERSSNTYENALFAAEALRKRGIRRIALVVDARSMPRAAASFRKQGIEVTPAPSSFRQWGPPMRELIPSWRAIRRNEEMLHEVLGMVWYRLRGWI
jgi:uncharacterized SAM-binding protein YcdF (DUF218 family)